LDVPGFDSRQGQESFLQNIKTSCGSDSASYAVGSMGSFPEGYYPCSAEVKNERNYTSVPQMQNAFLLKLLNLLSREYLRILYLFYVHPIMSYGIIYYIQMMDLVLLCFVGLIIKCIYDISVI
jgi:hypothetical protein